MSDISPEPSLPQFEPDQWVFPDEASREEYVLAVEQLRQVLKSKGIMKFDAPIEGQPTVEMVREIVAGVAKERDELEEPVDPTGEIPSPMSAVTVPAAQPPRRWWQRRPR